MTPAQALLLPITALMLMDMRQTLHGLRTGFIEKNGLARALMERFGLLRGMLAYEAGVFTIFGGLALLFPSQWAIQSALAVDLALTVNSNRLMLGKQ